MSTRGLNGLEATNIVNSRLHSEKPQSPRRTMEELQAELERVHDELQAKNEELSELKTATDIVKTEVAEIRSGTRLLFRRCRKSCTKQNESPAKLCESWEY